MATIRVPLKTGVYSIHIESGLLKDGLETILRPFVRNRRCLLISDTNVAPHYVKQVRKGLQSSVRAVATVVIPAGEITKDILTVMSLYDEATQAKLDRASSIVALGGGVLGDIAGFVASTYLRGIGLIHLPTSLLAQVDSAIGGKNGINLVLGKNLIGTFHQPHCVGIDVQTLCTLSKREIRSGLAEVVKYAVVFDRSFLEFLEMNAQHLLQVKNSALYEEIVLRCCRLKTEIIVKDTEERNARALLNYGHTFAHALECVTGYQRFTHGEAISIGMGMAADLAYTLEPSKKRKELIDRQDALLEAIGLPIRMSMLHATDILQAMETDKKRYDDDNQFIVPTELGHAIIVKGIPKKQLLHIIGARCDR